MESTTTTRFDFRLPQFSEDFVWLPDWLQQSRSQCPGDGEVGIADGGSFEGVQQDDETRCADFQLFLSGDDSSRINFSPCPAKANHFYLRLSFTGLSQPSESQGTDEAEAVIRSSKYFPVENVGSTDQPLAKTPAQGNSCRKFGRHAKDALLELSIAASEAVVIHELVESEPALRPIPMESVVEVAMRVKEARLQEIDSAHDVFMDDACADDFLMDLDDLTMLDAFQDVGLPMVIPDDGEFRDIDISQVQETPVAKIQNMMDCDHKFQDTRHRTCGNSGQSDSLAELPLEEQPKEKLPSESLTYQIICDVLEELPSEGTLLLPREKGMDADVPEKWVMAKSIPKLFVCETSFFSESADVAQSQNYVDQHPGANVGETTEVKVFLNDSYDLANNGIAFSHEGVGSSCASLVDPLCSVVPCSVPNEMDDMLGQPASRGSVENLSDPEPLFEQGNLHKATRERNEPAKASEPEEDCHKQTGYQKSFLSSKTFSVLSSNCETKLAKTRFVPIFPGYSELMPPMDSCKCMSRLTGKLCDEGTVAVADVGIDQFNNFEHSTGRMVLAKSMSGDCTKDAAEILLCEKQERKLPHITGDRKIHTREFDYLAEVCSQRDEEKPVLTPPNALKVYQRKKSLRIKLQHNYLKFSRAPRKRVRFSGVDVDIPVSNHSRDLSLANNKCTPKRSAKRPKHFNSQADQDMKNLARVISNDAMPLLFHGIGFLLTGFSRSCEKEIEVLIHKHGGVVIVDVPSTNTGGTNVVFKHCLVVVTPKKLKTTKFLYGCAVGAFLLKFCWIVDSLAAGCTLPPKNYQVLPNRIDSLIIDQAKSFGCSNAGRIFCRVGFVLHGRRRFFVKFAKVIKHGGGEAYGNLHQLIQRLDSGKVFSGIIVMECNDRPSRHLYQCAAERNITMMSTSWLIECLYSGELLSRFD